MQVIAGVNGLMREVIENQIKMHMAADGLSRKESDEGAAELIDVLNAYLT